MHREREGIGEKPKRDWQVSSLARRYSSGPQEERTEKGRQRKRNHDDDEVDEVDEDDEDDEDEEEDERGGTSSDIWNTRLRFRLSSLVIFVFEKREREQVMVTMTTKTTISGNSDGGRSPTVRLKTIELRK
uniref:Uncharacterized protein n=1 Tax=Vespula pensylvanica TaxID=30213 RepID=A0A834KHW1_VESPE|nr:hypothetical protein H0235_014493 [Vespula pensylvanica]